MNFELSDDENLEKTNNQITIRTTSKFPKNDKQDKKKKKTRKENMVEEIPFEEQEFIEYCLMDFKGVEELQKFKNIKSLSLISQNIKSFKEISSFSQASQLEFLCLNENLLENFTGVGSFKNLKELHLNFNSIEKISDIQYMPIKILSLSENKIKKIEGLPMEIENLQIASNLISNLTDNLLEYENLKHLNIAGNLLSTFCDLRILSNMKGLEELNLNDPNYGENPICLINNYRLFVLHLIPKLKILDEAYITKEENEEFEYIYLKKTTFYKNKIKQMNRICKLSFKLLKIFSWSFKMMKSLQILFFRKRIKMLQYIQYERISQHLGKISNLNNNDNSELETETRNPLLEKSIEISQQIEKENAEEISIDKENKEPKNKEIPKSSKKKEINNELINEMFIHIKNNNTVTQNILKDDVIEEMNKEIETTNEKIKKCLNNFQTVNSNLNNIKKFIAEVNDFSIICNFYELESGGNLKLEQGLPSDKWALSCIELMKNRISQSFYSKNSIKNLNVMKVWKITNKPRKLIFDNNYDYLIEINDKFGDERKFYDFFFMFFEEESLEGITKKLFENFNNHPNEDELMNSNKIYDKRNINKTVKFLKENSITMLSTHLDKFEEFKLNKAKNENENSESLKSDTKTKRLYTVICKCITYENLISKSSENFEDEISDFSDLDQLIKDWSERNPNPNSFENSILEIMDSKQKDKSILLTKNKSLIIPEYILEYNYSLNSTNLNINNINISNNCTNNSNLISNSTTRTDNLKSQGTAKIITSSYVSKESFSFLQKEDFIQIFNNSLRNLTNCEIKKHLSKEIIENYSNCKPQYISELNSPELFFSKNSILNFLYMSHRYSNPESFTEEFNKILDKLEEIKNLNFKNPLITISDNKVIDTPSRSQNVKSLKKEKDLMEFSPRMMNTEVNITDIKNKKTSKDNLSTYNDNPIRDIEFTLAKINLNNIFYLNLFQSNIDDNSYANLIKVITPLNSLKILNLSFNSLTKINLLDLLINFENLNFLDFSNNQINDINLMKSIEKTNEISSSNLEILDISFNCLEDFSEILTIIKLANNISSNIINNNKNLPKFLFQNLHTLSFFGNPFPYKISEYLIEKDFLTSFYFSINKNSKSITSEKRKYEEFFNFVSKLLEGIELAKTNTECLESSDEGLFYKNTEGENVILNKKTNIESKFELTKITDTTKLHSETNSHSGINNKSMNSDCIYKIMKTDDNKNLLMPIEDLKKSEFVEKTIKYNLINDLKHFNVIYHTYSIKKFMEDKEELQKNNISISNLSNYENTESNLQNNTLEKENEKLFSKVDDQEFNDIFQEKVDNKSSSNALLLSKQKLNGIPILAKNKDNLLEIDLIFIKHPKLFKMKINQKIKKNLNQIQPKISSTEVNIQNTNNNLNNKEDNYLSTNSHGSFLNINYEVEALKMIKILYLNINKLTNLNYLDQFISLEELYLQNNKLKTLPSFPMNKLKKLDISNNYLHSLANISNLKKLNYLRIESNLVNNLCLNELLLLTELDEFNISGNNIFNIKECITLKNMNKLVNIDLSGNDVCNNNDFRLTLINYIPKLKILNRIAVDKNEYNMAKEYFEGRITTEILESKIGTRNTLEIQELDLSNNKLKDFESIFTNLNYTKLKRLDLSKNLYSSFKIFGYLPSLIELHINFNLFEKFMTKKDKGNNNKALNGLPNLEVLEISENNITDLTGIYALGNLRTLVLRANNINKMDALDGLMNLQYLDISFNKLRNVERSNIGTLPNLKIFICDSNYLKNINSFSKLQNLSYISFENNKISDIANIEKLSDLETLKEINLINNPLTKVVNYRVNMIRKFYYVMKIDGVEVSNEEREIAIMDQTMQPIIPNVVEQMQQNNIYMNKMENTKMAMKVNFVNLDLMSGRGLNFNLMNPRLNFNNDDFRDKNISPLRSQSVDPINVINGNQISYHPNGVTNKNFVNLNRKMQKNQVQQIISSSNNKTNLQKNPKQQQQKNNQNSGNLFKQIGEVISSNHQNELAKQNPISGSSNNDLPKAVRPKSITYRK